MEDWGLMKDFVLKFAKLVNDPEHNAQAFKQQFFKSLSIGMFVLMPVFALLLWLFWGKPRPFYIDSVIFSIHLHAFLFLTLIIKNLIFLIYEHDCIDLGFLLLFLAYLIVGIMRLKEISFARATLKTVGLSLAYLLVVFLTFIGIAVLSVWFL